MAWVLAVPALLQTGPEETFSRQCPLEGRHRPEPGARAARGFYVAWVLAVPALFQTGPEVTFSRLNPFEGWNSPEPGVRAARGFCVPCKELSH
jgi:hypothetical protein